MPQFLGHASLYLAVPNKMISVASRFSREIPANHLKRWFAQSKQKNFIRVKVN